MPIHKTPQGHHKLYKLDLLPQDHLPYDRSVDNIERRLPVRFDARDVSALKISDKKIGEGWFGKVYYGRIKFKNGATKRVAIKVFKAHVRDHIYDIARAYETVIKTLFNKGIRFPKMGLVKVKDLAFLMPKNESRELLSFGDYVLVSELYGSAKKGSRLIDLYDKRFYPFDMFDQGRGFFIDVVALKDPREIKDLADLWIKLINAGFYPDTDVFSFYSLGNRLKPIIIDLDLLVEQSLDVDPKDEFLKFLSKDLGKIRSLIYKLPYGEQNGLFARINYFLSYLLKHIPQDLKDDIELELSLLSYRLD